MAHSEHAQDQISVRRRKKIRCACILLLFAMCLRSTPRPPPLTCEGREGVFRAAFVCANPMPTSFQRLLRRMFPLKERTVNDAAEAGPARNDFSRPGGKLIEALG